MNARLPIRLLALVIALPLAVAGCGNTGPLVLPQAAPADIPVDDDATTDDTIEELGADPIPEVGGDDDGND